MDPISTGLVPAQAGFALDAKAGVLAIRSEFTGGNMHKKKYSAAENRSLLVAALRTEPGRRFRASDLKRTTGVSKSTVRGLLTAVDGVIVSRERGAWWFSAAQGAA